VRPGAGARARWLAGVAAVALAGAAAAGGPLSKLPPDRQLPQGDGSPGQVTFSHASHVDSARPNCVTCHPRNFRILASGKTASGEPLNHDRMKEGAACGACHARTAFDFETCDNCHK
jgi:c(7)-type cytochrome triheme protein